jgi:hypothetical protein
MPVIGVLNSASSADYVPMMAAFHRGLSETGYVEGRNGISLGERTKRSPAGAHG